MQATPLKVMVLAGGPDREREVSLASGREVAAGLKEAGHQVELRDITPDNLAALDEFADWGGDVVFPALHGPWGEGGRLQRVLDERGFPYVGSAAPAAELAIDKQLSKIVFQNKKLPTPEFEFLRVGEPMTMAPPVVLKPYNEGSSIDVVICHDRETAERARADLCNKYRSVLVERFVRGRELTVGVLGGVGGVPAKYEALPPIEIVSAATFYDYDAKYDRDDTQYLFDIDLPEPVLSEIRRLALQAHRVLGCRHLSRVDFLVDEAHRPWCLEVNTIPGFTSHSLLPKAAARAGIAWPALLDRLVRLPLGPFRPTGLVANK